MGMSEIIVVILLGLSFEAVPVQFDTLLDPNDPLVERRPQLTVGFTIQRLPIAGWLAKLR
jgi:hypothetical protein